MQDIEELYAKYFETVNKYLFCLTHNADVSEELTQETFCKAIQNIHNFKGNCKVSVWLCQIAKNLWYDELKKIKKVDNIDENILFSIESNDNIENNIICNDSKLQLYKKMQELDEKTREVIYLRITGELSFKEISNILDKSESWARVTFYRGKQKLKEVNYYEREQL